VSRDETLRPRAGKVVSVRDVENAAKNGRAIVVAPDTVITPAARERATELNVSIRVQRDRGQGRAPMLASVPQSDDLIEPLAAFVVAAATQPLPEEVLDQVKLLLTDSLAAGYAGLRCQPLRALVDALAARRHGERGHLIGLRQKLAPPDAALVNAALIHAFGFDAWFERGAVAPVAGPVATALAVADETRLRDPKALLPAIAVGVEVGCRVAAAATGGPALSRSAAIAALGGAATAGVLLELDADAMVAAFGLALSQALYPPDHLTDLGFLAPGFGAQAAVQAARLAAGGVQGIRRVIEGPAGYAQLIEGGRFDRSRALAGLGASWLLEEVALRLYPVDPAAAIVVEAAVRLIGGRAPSERFAQVVVEGSPRVLHPTGSRPEHAVASGAASSRLPYLVARTLRDGWLGLAAIDPAAPIEPEVWDLIDRIELAVAPDIAPDALAPVRLVALTTDGLLHESTVLTPPGSTKDETTRLRVLAKLTDCWRWSGQPRYRRPLRLADAVDTLDRARSLSAFWSAVSPQAAL
jgi:2-methylcitrate dehydratase PrpD